MKIFSFPPIVNKNSKVLVLGTMPGVRSLTLNQYYGHKGNQFWKLIFDIYDQPFSTNYNNRCETLLKYNIALWDVLKVCVREGSADNNIKYEVANEISSFLNEHPLITTVCFNGKKAEQYFYKHIGKPDGVEFKTFPSTSPANTWFTYQKKLVEWMDIKKLSS